MVKAKVKVRVLNVRKDLDDYELYQEIMETFHEGDFVTIDETKIHYSWNDKKYYQTKFGGYVNVEGVEVVKE